MNTRNKPVSFVVAAAIVLMAIMLYDIMGAIAKNLGQQYPAQQLSMFRNLFGLIPTLLILFYTPNWNQAGKPVVIRQWRFALVRGGIGALAQTSFYLALLHMEFATATAIVFAGPLFVTALSVPLLGQRVGLWRWLAVLIGFVGVMLVMRPTGQSISWYAILPLVAAFGYASIAVTARLFDDTVPTAIINLYANVGSLVGSTTLVIFAGGFVPISSLQDWMWFAAMGVAGSIAAYLLITAYRLAEPSSLSPFEYFGIPFSFFLGWVFFAETPFDRLIPGVFFIVGGGLAIIWREHSMKNRRVH